MFHTRFKATAEDCEKELVNQKFLSPFGSD